jgi:hypothetical protein
MPKAAKGCGEKGRQPLSPPQHTVTPEREKRVGLKLRIISSSEWPNGPTGAQERKRYGGRRDVSAIGRSSPAFKTHNTTVPNGFLQVAVSKTLPAIMNAAPGLLLAGSVPDTALILRGRSRRNRRHILTMTVYLANHDARAGCNLSGMMSFGARAQIGPDKRFETGQSA